VGKSRGFRADNGPVIPGRIADYLYDWFGKGAGVSVSPIRDDLSLFPEEEDCVARAVPQRRAEFSTGRWCARSALAQLQAPQVAIPMGPRRAPIWPHGFTGSITHASGICAAVVLRTENLHGIGIDIVEPSSAEPTIQSARPILFQPGEAPSVLAFSAKESVIKAVSAHLDRWIEFTDVIVQFSGARFTATVHGATIEGWSASIDHLLLTAARCNYARIRD
jgi:4'-phosphopantetheinyl transferase EntD